MILEYSEQRKFEEMGYTIKTDSRGHFQRAIKGSRIVWPIRDGYQTADLRGGKYCNHLRFKSLEDAAKREMVK